MSAAPTIPSTSPERIAIARRIWEAVARPEQREPEGSWRVWLIRSGRGAGKTRTGSEWIRERVAQGARRIALVAESAADCRDVMVEGNSGILSVYAPSEAPKYEPSKRRLTWPNGAVATCYAGDAPDQLRGPEHDTVWCDELAKFDYSAECWANVQMGCRIMSNGLIPRVLVTTTPRPIPIIREIQEDADTHLTVTSTKANRKNLDPHTLKYLFRRYEGTRIGRQELEGELLEDVEGAIVSRSMIDAARVAHPPADLGRLVIGIDPAATSGEDSDLTGIIVAGADHQKQNGYVLEDASGRYTPAKWARKAVDLYHKHSADRIVAEINNGGEMVEHTLRMVDPNVPVRVVHATRGKHVRFEPIGALYEQNRIRHIGSHPELEDQVCLFTPEGYEGGDSPDRADAAVWALTDLMLGGGASMSDVLTAMEQA